MTKNERTEAVKPLKANNLTEWLKTRREVDIKMSSKQSVFCICGKLATGLHETRCTKFNNKVDQETVNILSHLLTYPEYKTSSLNT